MLDESVCGGADRGAGGVGNRGRVTVSGNVVVSSEIASSFRSVERPRELGMTLAFAPEDEPAVRELTDAVVPPCDLLSQISPLIAGRAPICASREDSSITHFRPCRLQLRSERRARDLPIHAELLVHACTEALPEVFGVQVQRLRDFLNRVAPIGSNTDRNFMHGAKHNAWR